MAKKSRIISVVILIIIFILLLGFILFVFNIGGARNLFSSFMGRKDTSQSIRLKNSEQDKIEREKKDIETEKTKLSALRTDLENYKVQLESRKKELDEKEILLSDKEREVERLRDRLSIQFDDLGDLVKIYEEMDGEEAAAILNQMEETDKVILLIKNLKKEKSAEILGLMEPKKAADILSELY